MMRDYYLNFKVHQKTGFQPVVIIAKPKNYRLFKSVSTTNFFVIIY